MKKLILSFALVLLVCLCSAFKLMPARRLANVKHLAPLQGHVQPFCKFAFIDHRGHSIKLSTNIMHASNKSLTFIFDTGEKLTLNFTAVRQGHFVAESARSKDPQIIYYQAHSTKPLGMVGAIVITSVKPVSGNFSHLVSDDDDIHVTLVSGSFTF